MEITLIRHGEPEYQLSGRAKAEEISDVVKSYDLSGIRDGPSEEVMENVSNICTVVCSDLRRSIESAKALGFKEIHCSHSTFREVAIPQYATGEFTMSINNWGVFLRVISSFCFSRNGESLSMARRSAKAAASYLINSAQTDKSVILVRHGCINYFIAKELLKKKWVGPGNPGREYWDCGTYKYSAT